MSTEGKDAKSDSDFIVTAPWIVPVVPDGVLCDHALIIKKGKIADILPQSDAQSKYPHMSVIDRPHHVLMPGLVNAHTHVGMTLLRGYADDHPLHSWLTEHIWPAEKEFVNPDFVRDATTLGVAEMIRSGTTLFNEMYFYPAATAEVIDKSGIRGVIGMAAFDFPSGYASNFDEYISNGLAVYDRFKDHSRITFAVAPHAPYTVADTNWLKVKELARERGCIIHTHLHETHHEVNDSRNGEKSMSCHLSEELVSPLDNLHRLGIVNESLVAAHMVHLDEEHIELVARQKASIVHCPSSNTKLASGLCEVAKLTKAGVNVALGTDSVASNNSLDMLSEMKIAALLSKVVASDATVIPAAQALKMATINGAKALGLLDKVGSLEVGKSADFIAISLNYLELQPLYDVLSHLVYSVGRESVSDMWVEGRQLLQDRKLLTLNEQDIIDNAKKWATVISTIKQGAP